MADIWDVIDLSDKKLKNGNHKKKNRIFIPYMKSKHIFLYDMYFAKIARHVHLSFWECEQWHFVKYSLFSRIPGRGFMC